MTDPNDPATISLTLRTLGGAGLWSAGNAEPRLGPGKPYAMLTYLALTPGRRIPREVLLELLWGDLEPDRARNALRQSLWSLRRVLGEDAVPGTEELTLARPIVVDRDVFLDAIERGALEEALDAYAGEFLPAFGVPGGAAFEQWADLERSRLRAAFVRTSELLARRLVNQSRFREAQRVARRARDEAPGTESAWRLLLDTIVAGRDFVGAAVEADALEQWAAAEERPLEPATRLALAAARQIAPGAHESGGERALVAELTGREREFSAIVGAWAQARDGPSRHVHLSAEAGIGKSRLVRDATARLAAAGAAVVSLRGTPGDRDVPYAFAGDLASALAVCPGAAGIAPASAAALIALNPALSSRLAGQPDPAAGEEALRRRIHALVDLLQAVAEEQPLVLAIDDLHWLDDTSWRVLEGVFGRLREAPVLCLTASRPERRPSGDAVTLLPLAPLAPGQVAELVLALGTVPDAEPVGRELTGGLHAATRGSPLLVLETLRLAMDDGILALDDGAWRCADPTRLAALLREGEALRQRVRALPDDEGWVLAMLAVAGVPSSTDALAAATARSRETIEGALASLERLGLAARAGAAWIPSHDEIGAAARDALPPERRRVADHAIGELLLAPAHVEPAQLLRGVRHLDAAAEPTRVAEQYRRYVRLVRERGDRRPFRELAAELLGEADSSPRSRALAAALPWSWRAGLWSARRRAAAAAVVVLLAAGPAVAMRAQAMRAGNGQRLVYADSSGVARMAVLRADAWEGGSTPIPLSRSRSTVAGPARASTERAPAVSPDGRSVAWNVNAGDSTTIDIWIRTPAGTRRLTTRARDDVAVAWLPDGSALVGLTNQWSPSDIGSYDVAVYDTATGVARQVTRGPDHEGQPWPSPDGTRIAFVRESEEFPTRACVVALDGAEEPECRRVGPGPVARVIGWSGANELVAVIDSSGVSPLVRYDWQRRSYVTLFGPYVLAAQLSPDRRLVAATVRVDGVRGTRDWVVPIDRPTQARPVATGASGSTARWWEGPPDRGGIITEIAFDDSAARTILAGVGTRLRVHARTASGTEVPLLARVRWRSSDTSVAAVDSTGVVRARSSGEATIEASLAGWRATRRTLRVHAAPVREVFVERWSDDWTSRWIPFGEPSPVVARGPGGERALWSRGDGVYVSTVLTRQAFDARDGLGVELRLSTPITRASWQRARTHLTAGIDTATVRRADPRGAPPPFGDALAGCGAEYPAFEGRWGAGRVGVHGGLATHRELGPDSLALPTGAWWTLRLQLLPDGRCGVAVNGRVLFLSPEPIALNRPFRLRLGDESAGTRIVHGALTVWTGVRTDVDWGGAP